MQSQAKTDVDSPQGVELYDWDDFPKFRRLLEDGVMSEVQRNFPQSYGGVRMEVSDLNYGADPEDYDIHAQKAALQQDKFLSRRLKGTVNLFDDKTGDLLDTKKGITLMKVPWLTERGTFIHNGSEYTVINQSRLLPGAYSRRQESGELETQFNARPGSGPALRIGFVPETAQYYTRVGGSQLHLYSMLKDMGVDDDAMRTAWGEKVFEANAAKYDSRVFPRAVEKIVPARVKRELGKTQEEQRAALKDAIERIQINEWVARRNLPNLFDRTKSAEWQARALARSIVDAQMEALHAGT